MNSAIINVSCTVLSITAHHGVIGFNFAVHYRGIRERKKFRGDTSISLNGALLTHGRDKSLIQHSHEIFNQQTFVLPETDCYPVAENDAHDRLVGKSQSTRIQRTQPCPISRFNTE